MYLKTRKNSASVFNSFENLQMRLKSLISLHPKILPLKK